MPVSTGNKSKLTDLARDILLERKNRAIFVYSELCKKQYEFLYKFSIQNLDSKADEIDIAIMSFNDEQVVIINDMLPGILNLCKSEWIGGENPVEIVMDVNKRKKCSLCNQPNNKWVYNITNRLNNLKMNVGSTCIGEFPSIELRRGMTRNQLEKEARKQEKLQILTLNFPHIRNIVESWEEQIDNFEILIPNQIEKPYLECGNKLKEIYNNFIMGKIGNGVFQEIQDLLKDRNQFIAAMKEYEEESLNDKFVVTRKIVNWLKMEKEDQTIETLKQTGYIDYKTASSIQEPDFLETVREEFNFIFSDLKIEIIGLDDEKRGYIIKPFKDKELKLICPFTTFLSYYGWVLFGEKRTIKFSLYNVFKSSKLYDKYSIELTFQKLANLLKGTVYSILLYETREYDFSRFNRIVIKNNKNKLVIETDLKNFLEEFKIYAFEIRNFDVNEITLYLESLDNSQYKKYSFEEYSDLRSVSAEFNKREF